jgi:conjugative relaxase-like TrwC/TraI family protein
LKKLEEEIVLVLQNIRVPQGNSYYEAGYYGEPRWFGKAAGLFHISGNPLKEADFKNLLQGKSPGGTHLFGRSLNSEKENQRAGLDCVFCAPKSISLQALVAKDERLIEAHRQSVRKALVFMETECAQTRIYSGGVRSSVRTGNLAIALFDHVESRERDPHLHTHCVVMNVTRRLDKKWRGLWNTQIYLNRGRLSEIYQKNLASEVESLGYEVRERERGFYELGGYGVRELEVFSKRRQQILSVVGGRDSSTKQRFEAWKRTRRRKVPFSLDKLRERWYREVEEKKITLLPIPYLEALESKWGKGQLVDLVDLLDELYPEDVIPEIEMKLETEFEMKLEMELTAIASVYEEEDLELG